LVKAAAAAAAAAAVAAPKPTDVQQGTHGQADRHFRGLTAAVVVGFIEKPSLRKGAAATAASERAFHRAKPLFEADSGLSRRPLWRQQMIIAVRTHFRN
jgi:hypothetical protein